ncbi:MAG: hypothetical protein NVSMB63_16760 [Sediminibacterium sp.]
MPAEYWLQPRKFFYSVRETAHIRFLAGENFNGTGWNSNKLTEYQLLHYTPSGEIIDLSQKMQESKGDSLPFPLQEEGTHVITCNTTRSFIDPDAVNTHISAKILIQAGYLITDACLQPASLPLDILPAENPYDVPALKGREQVARVKFRVMFLGKPLPGQLVKIGYLQSGRQPERDTAITDNKGWINIERHSGPCLLSCTYTEKNRPGAVTGGQRYQSSLSFEYPQFFLQRQNEGRKAKKTSKL